MLTTQISVVLFILAIIIGVGLFLKYFKRRPIDGSRCYDYYFVLHQLRSDPNLWVIRPILDDNEWGIRSAFTEENMLRSGVFQLGEYEYIIIKHTEDEHFRVYRSDKDLGYFGKATYIFFTELDKRISDRVNVTEPRLVHELIMLYRESSKSEELIKENNRD